MEDLKQIQEFFLNENVFVEAFKLEKALKGMGYNVKVKYLDDFGKDVFEIYFNNPADADDDSIFYDAKKLGYDNVRVFANPQESVSEADLNDPVAMKMRAAKMKADKLAKLRAANAGDDGNDKFFEKSTARLRKLKALKDKRAQIMRDMEQEAEIEGGAVADKYGDMLNKLDKAISMLGEAVNDPRIDNSKFGPSPRKFAELRAQMGDEALLDKIQMMDVNILVDVLDELSLMQESTIVNEYDVYMPSQEEVDQFFEKETHLQTHYLNSKPVMGQEGSFNKTEVQPWDEYDYSNWKALVSKALEEYNAGIYYNPTKDDTSDKAKEAGDSAFKKVKDMIQKVLKEEEGYSKYLKTDDNPEGKTKGLDTKTMNKILMNVIKDLDESRPGLWDNIRAKKAKGEKPSHGNSKAHKDAVKAGKRINKEK